MWKKVLLGLLGLIVLASIGLFLWVRSVLTTDAVQVALSQQISSAIGQPVAIGRVSASIYPRITVALEDVAIGGKSEIHVKALDVGTNFRALLSRRIEHATLQLRGAKVQLPLPPMTLDSDAPNTAAAPDAAVHIVSIDAVVLSEVEIVSGGRTLIGNIEVVPQGEGLTIKHIGLTADDMSLTATGTLTNLAGPVGEVAVKAEVLNVDRLLAFFHDFSGGFSSNIAPPTGSARVAGPAATAVAAPTLPGGMNLTVSLEAERATLGGLTIEQMSGKARATDTRVSLEPLSFSLFNGNYDGGLSATLGTAQPTFQWKARVSGINVAAAMAYAGWPNTISGTANATIDIAGTGTDIATAMKTVAGRLQLEVLNGVVKNLGIIRAVGAATASSLDGLKKAQVGASNTDEPFTRIGATVTLANGAASSRDMKFDATDLALQAEGVAQLDGSSMNLKGRVQLSREMSAQVNPTVLKAAQEGGRLTLPATITGSLAAPVVRVDVADLARRALRNTINDQAPGLINRLRGLMRR